MGDRSDIEEALAAVQAFGAGAALTGRIADLETRLHGKTRDKATALLTTSLPYVLKRGEVIESLSLGAGNTGRQHDLEIDRQIAEFRLARGTW